MRIDDRYQECKDLMLRLYRDLLDIYYRLIDTPDKRECDYVKFKEEVYQALDYIDKILYGEYVYDYDRDIVFPLLIAAMDHDLATYVSMVEQIIRGLLPKVAEAYSRRLAHFSKSKYVAIRTYAKRFVTSKYDRATYEALLEIADGLGVSIDYGYLNYDSAAIIDTASLLWEIAGGRMNAKYKLLATWYIRQSINGDIWPQSCGWRLIEVYSQSIPGYVEFMKRLDVNSTVAYIRYWEALAAVGVDPMHIPLVQHRVLKIFKRVNYLTCLKIAYLLKGFLGEDRRMVSMQDIPFNDITTIKKFDLVRRLPAVIAWRLVFPEIAKAIGETCEAQLRSLPHPGNLGKGTHVFLQLIKEYVPDLNNPRDIIAIYKIAWLFKNAQKAKDWLKRHGWSAQVAAFTIVPPRGRELAPAWGDFFYKHPEACKYMRYMEKIPQHILDKVPTTLSEFKDLMAVYIYDEVKYPQVARLASKFKLGQSSFDLYQKVYEQKKAYSKMPDITVRGSEIGRDDTWVFRKLGDDDPTGLFLGLITNCCQHLEGAGAQCVEDGWTRPESGFYVVEYKGQVVAQSWAWLGKDNALVFDNIEALGGPQSPYLKVVSLLYKRAAEKIIQHKGYGIETVAVGVEYGISEPMANYLGLPLLANPVRPLFAIRYTDAKKQFLLASNK